MRVATGECSELAIWHGGMGGSDQVFWMRI